MGHKNVCFECRKSLNTAIPLLDRFNPLCPQCGGPLVYLDQNFRPPRRNSLKEWAVVKFLYDNGFNFQHIYRSIDGSNRSDYVPYPTTMKDALEFVEKYKDQR